MGQWIAPKHKDYMPQLYSYNHYQQTATETNDIAKLLCKNLHFLMTIQIDSLAFNFTNWKKSRATGSIGLGPKRVRKLTEQGTGDDQYECPEQLQINMEMSQIYQMHEILKHFKRQDQDMGNTPLQGTPTAGQEKTCEICYDEEPNLALPCGHRFGSNCVQKYIIEKDQRICPMCRRQFLCGRSTIQRNIFTVIENEDDQFVYQEIRGGLMNILRKNNQMEICKLQAFLTQPKSVQK